MNRRALRVFIPLIVVALAGSVVVTMFFSPRQAHRQQQQQQAASQPASATATNASSQRSGEAAAAFESPATPAATQTVATQPVGALRAVAASLETPSVPQSLGSLDPRISKMQLELTYSGAGIKSIAFADIWTTAASKRRAREYFRSLAADAPVDFAKLDEANRYFLQTAKPFTWLDASGMTQSILVPILSAHSLTVNGVAVSLIASSAWSQTEPGLFESRIVDESDRELLRVSRRFLLGSTFDVTIQTRVRNVSGGSLDVLWSQYGPIELNEDAGLIDRRRFGFGYLPDPMRLPELVLTDSSDMVMERGDLLKRLANGLASNATLQDRAEYLTIWPNKHTRGTPWELSWFTTCNRYFAMATHPVLSESGQGNRALKDVVREIRIDVSPADILPGNKINPQAVVFSFFNSPVRTLQPSEEWPLDMGVYSGPLDRHILSEPPFSFLAMDGMILYQMSSMCAFCTFQWLAHGLLWFLSAVHAVTFDWGISIIILVLVVRMLLHPITKKSQINMQRFGKQMGSIKPEIEKLQKKFGDDPKKMQQEQMRLMREHGINPLQMLGCLPMFLQMPIWLALYAMLYFAFDLRQQPAFYGVFQLFGGWPFLSDLSSEDKFIPLGGGFYIPILGTHIDSINLLPLLMAVVFYIQQKYMTPPPSPTMTKEQLQQQQIMKWMMVIMFPLFMYKVPCGLTLYIFTSTCFGIMESKYVRAHIDQLDKNPPATFGDGSKPAPKKSRDPIARAWAERLERARAKAQEHEKKSFKKRK